MGLFILPRCEGWIGGHFHPETFVERLELLTLGRFWSLFFTCRCLCGAKTFFAEVPKRKHGVECVAEESGYLWSKGDENPSTIKWVNNFFLTFFHFFPLYSVLLPGGPPPQDETRPCTFNPKIVIIRWAYFQVLIRNSWSPCDCGQCTVFLCPFCDMRRQMTLIKNTYEKKAYMCVWCVCVTKNKIIYVYIYYIYIFFSIIKRTGKI